MNFSTFTRTLVLIGLIIITTSCSKTDDETPNCIDSKIVELKNAPMTNPPTEVWKWEDGENIYYYITADCCDQYNYLYDENCNVICAPDGGFTGNGDGNCPEFSSEIVKTLLWKDDRK